MSLSFAAVRCFASQVILFLLLGSVSVMMVACGGASNSPDLIPIPLDQDRILQDINKPRVSGVHSASGIEGSEITLSVSAVSSAGIHSYVWEVAEGINVFQDFNGELDQSSVTFTLVNVDVTSTVVLRVTAVDVNGVNSNAHLISLTIEMFAAVNTISFDDDVLAQCFHYFVAQRGWTDIGQVTQLNCQENSDQFCPQGGDCLIRSLEGIDQLTSLEMLNVANNAIDDLSPLMALTQLNSLDLGATKPDDLGPVEQVDDVRITPLIDFTSNGAYSVGERGQIELEAIVTVRAPNATLSQSDITWTLTSGHASLENGVGAVFSFDAPNVETGVDEVVIYEVNATDSKGNFVRASIEINVYDFLSLSDVTFDDSELDRCVKDASIASGWQDVGEVIALDCLDYGVVTLDGLFTLPELKSLKIKNNIDIAPLIAGSSIENLTLQRNETIDFHALGGMNQLRELTISNITNYANLTQLRRLSMLKTLELNDIEFADSAELPDFTDFVSLDSLGLSRNLMREIDALKLPSTLRSLDLSDNDLDDIDALVPFDFLTSLHLGNNEHLSFEDVEVIDHFAASLNTDFPFFMVKQAVQDRIGDIALRNCVFDKGMVSAWSQVESYRNLECIGEGIISVDGLAFYSQLSSLTLSGNALTFFDIDGSMPNLRLLDLSGNDIDSFAELSILEELTELILAGNRISDLNGISGLVNLTDLSIANNQLTSLHGIEGLHFLTKLNAQNNAIEEVPDLSVLNWLTVLRLGSNNIDNINLTNIATAPAALELNLNNNSVITQLDNLYGMSRLNQIYLIGTVLECQEMVDLKAAIAGLEIIQDRGCVL